MMPNRSADIHVLPRLELGPDQVMWLRMFHTIDLDEWRLECLKFSTPQEIGWVYVGATAPGPVRTRNICNNRYHYWPRPPE